MLVEGIPQAATQNPPSSSLPTLPVANKHPPSLPWQGSEPPAQGPQLQGTPRGLSCLSASHTFVVTRGFVSAPETVQLQGRQQS